MAIDGINAARVSDTSSVPADYTSPSRAELTELAKALHDVGERSGKKDDYDRRLQALASEFLPTLSQEDRGRFMGAILDRDKGALKSWLQSDRLDKLVDDGRLGESDRKRVVDAVERGYADQHVEQDKASEFIDTAKVDKASDRPSDAPSKDDLVDLHKSLHDVGERRARKDDYDKRLAALATDERFLSGLDDNDRGRFMGVVFERDKGALKSWLQSDRLDKLVDEGRIDDKDRKRVVDSVERGYADGHIDESRASEFIDTGKADDRSRASSADDDKDKDKAAPKSVTEDGYKVAGAKEDVVYDDIKKVSYPGEFDGGWLRVDTKGGDKLAVGPSDAPDLHALAERKYLDEGQGTVDQTRKDARLPATKDTDLFAMKTDVEQDGDKLSVGEAAMKLTIDEIKGRSDLYDGSAQAQFLRLVEARSAVTNGRPIHPVYEDRISGAFKSTRTRTENLVRLEQADMQEIFDERALNRELDSAMRNEQVAELYQSKLTEAVGKVPKDERNKLADRLEKVVGSADYVTAANQLEESERPLAKADVEDALSQLALIDPDRAGEAGQTFALNALAGEIDKVFADPALVTSEARVDAVDAGLGAIKNGISKAKLPFDMAGKLDSVLKADKTVKQDFSKLLDGMRKGGHDDIDQVFSDTMFASDKSAQADMRSLVGDLSSNGLLPAITGAIGMTQTIRSLVSNGLGETPEEILGTVGGVLGMTASLESGRTLLKNVASTLDGSATDLLGMRSEDTKRLGLDSVHTNQATRAYRDAVADAPHGPGKLAVPDQDKIAHGLKDRLGDASDSKFDRRVDATMKVASKLKGHAAGMLGVVTGGMGLDDTASDADRAAGVLGVISGSTDALAGIVGELTKDGQLRPGVNRFLAAAGGEGAAVAGQRIAGAIARGAGPVGFVLTAVSELVSVFTGNAKAKQTANEQHGWFNALADDGVMQSDWNVKYDYARTMLGEFDNLHNDHVKNARALKSADWGGRQAPEDRSIFDFHRDEFAHFKQEWEKNRGAPTYVTFLDPGKRKADFKREADAMDEVKAYKKEYPTYHPGYNDWVLEP
ncbi:hypothetical protein MNO14_14335 [Luteimonas sp. S4-F44]|uniref:hypothetical protein n=1 Tax=Luteimonas sp. S4-F44 TaxID=2925842 RepID=UPI001F533DFC|nr:hypothetical protein [Luteimonas sp. S4-F44]UNK42107.1 hypothetical protein MNO14_14335 [Luteimonas sp. S4-F44]